MAAPTTDTTLLAELLDETAELNRRHSILTSRLLAVIARQNAILEAKTSGDPDWARVPTAKGRSDPGSLSRASIYRLIAKPHPDDPERPLIRSRRGAGITLYSRADLRAYLDLLPPGQQ